MKGSMKGRIVIPLLSPWLRRRAFAMPRAGGQQAMPFPSRGFAATRGGIRRRTRSERIRQGGYAVPRGNTGGYSPASRARSIAIRARATARATIRNGYRLRSRLWVRSRLWPWAMDMGMGRVPVLRARTLPLLTATTPITAAMAITRGSYGVGIGFGLLLRRGISRAIGVLCPLRVLRALSVCLGGTPQSGAAGDEAAGGYSESREQVEGDTSGKTSGTAQLQNSS
jgi:hypothetical protein